MADPLPQHVREVLAIPRDERTPAQVATIFRALADDRPRVEGRERPDRGTLEGAPRRFVATGPPAAREPARHAPAGAGGLPQARRGGRAGRPGLPEPLAGRCAPQPADLRPLAGRPRRADDGPLARQPGLAELFRHGDRQHERGPGLAERGADAPRAARLAGRRVHGPRLEPQGPSPADRPVEHVPAILEGDARTPAEGPGQPPAGPRAAVPGRGGGRPRHRPGRQRPARTRRSAGRASIRPRPTSCSSRRRATGRRSGTRRKAPSATDGRSTRSATARSRTPSSRSSTPRTATSRASAARGRTRRSRRSRPSMRRSFSNVPVPWP